MKVALYTLELARMSRQKKGILLKCRGNIWKTLLKGRVGWFIIPRKVSKIYADDITGYTLDRPALKQLLLDARRKKFDSVLVYKIDRFSRKLKDIPNLIDELEDMGIGFKSATEPFDTMTSAGKLMMQQ
jgi:site-specific DNA recombinase